ncbi:YraN family protein [Zunongwangia sp. HGR-M22]|uniref:YraN family protein n=1 Tax=Zunongwangia sp. HGR-M22 TaxID=3015168 RepID=UPI0022DE7B9C|nr:YraN family protein [Zunongwangia sp. HGR-M22]WBL25476.1 YraN family protein [Zunongwangia sp. HGR-M22]
MAGHNELGKKGEGLAIAFLKESGYKILDKNYRFQKAEVDIIAFKDEILVGVEVKTRSTAHFGNPQEFVKSGQIQRLVLAMNHYAEVKSIDAEIRFDIVAIIKNASGTKIELIEDAFFYF